MASADGFGWYDNPEFANCSAEENNLHLTGSKEILLGETGNNSRSRRFFHQRRNERTEFHELQSMSVHQSRENSHLSQSHQSSGNEMNVFPDSHSTAKNQRQINARIHQSSDSTFANPFGKELGVTLNTHPLFQDTDLRDPSKLEKPQRAKVQASKLIPCLSQFFSKRRNVSKDKDDADHSLDAPNSRDHEPSVKRNSPQQFTESHIKNDQRPIQINHQAPTPVEIERSYYPTNLTRNEPSVNPEFHGPFQCIQDIQNLRMVTKWLSQVDLCNRDSSARESSRRGLAEKADVSLSQPLSGELRANSFITSSNRSVLPLHTRVCYERFSQSLYQRRTENVNIIVYAPDQISGHRIIRTFARQPPSKSRSITYPLRLNVPRCGILKKVSLWHISKLPESIQLVNSSNESSRSVIVLVFKVATPQLVAQFNDILPSIRSIRRNTTLSIPIVLVGIQVDVNKRQCFNLSGYRLKARHGLSAFLERSIDSYEDIDSVFLTAIDVSLSHKV